MWAQRSKQMWLLNGDRNTTYFHSLVRQRKARNTITRLKDKEGNWIDVYEDLENGAGTYFSEISMLDNYEINNFQGDWLLHLPLQTFHDDQIQALSAQLTHGEIKNAFFQMSPYKSPGPDGLHACFYQKFWNIVGNDVVGMIKRFFTTGYILKELNQTLISLIPKTTCPTTFKEFRPISLCNVAYKAISKILVLRMQGMIKEMISPNQNAFIKGRLISDIIFLTAKMMDFIHKGKNKKSFWCAVKIDFIKAYDRVKWCFLEKVLKRMLFPDHLIQLIMQCVSTIQYSLLFNGQKTRSFTPQRGLRQGDPLSPYLFILCMNVLFVLIHRAEESNNIKGILFNRLGLMISHLMYADDLVLFFKADHDSCLFISRLLNGFCDKASLEINRDKSFLVFSPNTLDDLRTEMAALFNLGWQHKLGKYLGVFIDDHKDCKLNYQLLLDKWSSRLAGWKGKLLDLT